MKWTMRRRKGRRRSSEPPSFAVDGQIGLRSVNRQKNSIEAAEIQSSRSGFSGAEFSHPRHRVRIAGAHAISA